MCRRRRQGSARLAINLYNGSLQTSARHAILCFGQLELGRPTAPSVLQSQHRDKGLARISYHGVQIGGAATQRGTRRSRERARRQHHSIDTAVP